MTLPRLTPAPYGDPARFAGGRILLVDDNRVNNMLMTRVLEKHAFVVQVALTGEEALARYAQDPPDLVMLDVMLPGIDGYETCRRLRETYRQATAPIIFLTASEDSRSVVEGLAAGGCDYVRKPVVIEEVVARVCVHLHIRALAREVRASRDALAELVKGERPDLPEPLATIRSLASQLAEELAGTFTPAQHDAAQQLLAAVAAMHSCWNGVADRAGPRS